VNFLHLAAEVPTLSSSSGLIRPSLLSLATIHCRPSAKACQSSLFALDRESDLAQETVIRRASQCVQSEPAFAQPYRTWTYLDKLIT